MYKIEIHPSKGELKALLSKFSEDKDIPDNTIDEVSAKSYTELQVEIGNKNWHDLLNKNI